MSPAAQLVLFAPALAALFLALGAMVRDANPFARREVPMLDQLAALEGDHLYDVEPIYTEDDLWADYQTALNAPAATGTPDAIALTGVRR